MIIKKKGDLVGCAVTESLYDKFILFCQKYFNVQFSKHYPYGDLMAAGEFGNILFVAEDFTFDTISPRWKAHTILSEQDIDESITFLSVQPSESDTPVIEDEIRSDTRKDVLLEVSKIAQEIKMDICFIASGEIVLLDQDSNEYIIKSRSDLNKVYAAMCLLENFNRKGRL